jgi:hypothetical protein
VPDAAKYGVSGVRVPVDDTDITLAESAFATVVVTIAVIGFCDERDAVAVT